MAMSPGPSCGLHLLLDPGREGCSVVRLIKDEGGVDLVATQDSDGCHCLSVTIGHFCMEPLADQRRPTKQRQVGLGPSVVDKD